MGLQLTSCKKLQGKLPIIGWKTQRDGFSGFSGEYCLGVELGLKCTVGINLSDQNTWPDKNINRKCRDTAQDNSNFR